MKKIPLDPDADVITLADVGKRKDDFMPQCYTGQADGAYPNGSRVMKCLDGAGDSHKSGDMATVIGSLGPVIYQGAVTYGYFVNWDNLPGVPVFIASPRIKLVEEPK